MRINAKLSIILIICCLFSLEALAKESIAEVFNYLDNKKWVEAQRAASATGDKALLKIVLSQKFLNGKRGDNSFESVIKFIEANPHWPQLNKLKEKAEEYLDSATGDKVIINWFSKNKPLTGVGYKFYALASSRAGTDKAALPNIIRHGWIYGDFTLAEEKKYYATYSKYFTEKDHIKRIDEHLWRSDIAEAQRSMYLVSADCKRAFAASIAAMKKESTAESLFRKIPEKHYSSGLLFWYLKYKEKGEPTKDMVRLFEKLQPDPKHGHQWWRLQTYYAREFIDQKDFSSAYRVVATHFANNPSDISDAEFMAGWLALEYLKKPDLALSHFKKLRNVVKQPISIARANYWMGRTYEALGNRAQAIKLYKEASKYSYTFYGQIASIELKENKIVLPGHPKVDHNHRRNIENNDIVRAAKLLIKYGKPDLAQLYTKTALCHIKDPGEVLLAIELIKAYKNPYYLVEAAKTASQNHVFIKEFAFPTPYKLAKIPIEPALAYGIIRQESVFNQYAVSTANAMGLMQLVKATACNTARSIKLKCSVPKLTQDPQYNIKLGTTHLSSLIKEYDGSYILAIAAYNAGPKVSTWPARFGDPRKMKNHRQVINWLESIPFYETRNYVQRVLENIQVYRSILHKDSNLKLGKDLMR